MSVYLLDAVRILHLLGFAVGFGAAVLLETVLAKNIRRQFGPRDFQLMELAHGIITKAVLVLWATGLALVFIRTGGDLAAFSPKLITKLVIVSGLTANILMIARFVMPTLKSAPDGAFCGLGALARAKVGAITGLSAGLWIAALVLGAATGVKPLGFEPLLAIFGPLIAGAVLLGVSLCSVLGPKTSQLRLSSAP